MLVEALKGAEKLGGVLHVETGADDACADPHLVDLFIVLITHHMPIGVPLLSQADTPGQTVPALRHRVADGLGRLTADQAAVYPDG